MIEALTAAEATEVLRNAGLRITPETIRDGIQKKVFPFGNGRGRQESQMVLYL